MKRSLRSWLWRVPIEREVEDELALHAEMRRREGKSLDSGEMEQVRRACLAIARQRERQMRLTQWLEARRTDVRFALRQLRRAPGFAAVAVLTLALGIGANSAMFAVADATFFRALPFAYPSDRLAMIWETREGGPFVTVTMLDYRAWADENRTFAATAAVLRSEPTVLGVDGTLEQVPGQAVTPGFFETVGVTPLLGRTFVAADAEPPGLAVVVSEDFWRSRLGADPAALERPLLVGGRALDLIGVMPASFQFVVPRGGAEAEPGLPPQLWTVLNVPREGPPWMRGSHMLSVVGRLKPGMSLETAAADMNAIASRLGERFPDTNKGHAVTLQPLRDALIGREVRLTSLLLLGVVGFVLLMCCANIASLLLAQAGRRTRELAVRAALGAGRRRVIAQLVTESLVLASIGGVFALAVAAALLALAPSIVPPGVLPGTIALSFDGRVVAASVVSTLAAGILFGLAPAWQSTRARLTEALATEGRITRKGRGVRSALVAVQVAVAVLVLCGAGLLLRTLIAVQTMDIGARATELLTGTVGLPFPTQGGPSEFPTPASLLRFYDAVAEEVRAIPGVQSVAWGGPPPLDGTWYGMPFSIAGDPPRPIANRDNAEYHMVSASYFETLDIPLVAGRGFTPDDSAEAPGVCIVSEAFVARYLSGRNPIGMRLELPRLTLENPAPPPPVLEIIGVARQVMARAAETEPAPSVYVPLAQNPWYSGSLLVRPRAGSAAALAAPVRAALARVDSRRFLARVRTLETITDEATSRQQFRAVLVGAFAFLALLLATVGLFGVLSQSVQQRMREFGIRIALGASRRDVIGLVLHHAAVIAVAGMAAGLGLALMLGRFLAALIYPVAPLDPVTYAVVPLVALMTAAAGCVAPAWRATQVDPAAAFRED
jgi:putative ABC transport system permease protein